jgi:hypothetical protein
MAEKKVASILPIAVAIGGNCHYSLFHAMENI